MMHGPIRIRYINRALEDIKENIEISAEESLCLYELKQHKPWFEDEFWGVFRSKEVA